MHQLQLLNAQLQRAEVVRESQVSRLLIRTRGWPTGVRVRVPGFIKGSHMGESGHPHEGGESQSVDLSELLTADAQDALNSFMVRLSH